MPDDWTQLEFGEGEYDAFLKAEQVDEETTYTKASGETVTAEPGEWVVVTGDGLEVMEDWKFRQRYPEAT